MKSIKIFMTLLIFFTLTKTRAQQPFESTAEKLFYKKSISTGIRDNHSKMKAKLTGLFIFGNTLYFKTELRNKSTISFDIDFVRFYIKDKHTAKRTVTQEIEVTPLYIYGLKPKSVKGDQKKLTVFAFDKFTLADDKILLIEFYEKNGGRHLYLTVKNSDLENAIPFI